MIGKIIIMGINSLLNNIKFIFIKMFHPTKFKYNFINFISPFSHIKIRNSGKIKFSKRVKIESGSMLSSLDKGSIVLGKCAFINRNCYIVSHENISIGSNVIIGPNTVIVDHDHLFSEKGISIKKFKKKEIIIGNNTWIGANCVILKGTKIGKNCIIGAGSVVSENIPDGHILIQSKENSLKKIGDNR